MLATSVHLSPSPLPKPADLVRLRFPREEGPWAAWGSVRGRWLGRLRALIVCLSFALVCAPAGQANELSWSGRAVATLIEAVCGVSSAFGSIAAEARQGRPPATASAQGSSAAPRRAVLLAPRAARASRERAPGFDGRHLYLEQRALLC